MLWNRMRKPYQRLNFPTAPPPNDTSDGVVASRKRELETRDQRRIEAVIYFNLSLIANLLTTTYVYIIIICLAGKDSGTPIINYICDVARATFY